MSTVAEWSAAYDRIRARYPWLPEGVFTNWTASDRAFFTGLVNGRANFLVPLHLDVREQVMWHESGHTAHHQAAVLRDKAEGRGTAGDDIANEIAAILCGRSWTDPFDGLKNEAGCRPLGGIHNPAQAGLDVGFGSDGDSRCGSVHAE